MALTTSCLKELNSRNLNYIVKKNSTWLWTPLQFVYSNNNLCSLKNNFVFSFCMLADSSKRRFDSYIYIWIPTILAHNYPNGVDKVQLVSGSYYANPMTNNTLLTGFLFWQIFTVVLFTSKDFSTTSFTVAEKAMSCQTHDQNREIEEAIHVLLYSLIKSRDLFG